MRLSFAFYNSKVDTFYRSVLLTKFFIKGWGLPTNLRDIFNFRKVLSNRERCQSLVDKFQPIYIDKCVEKTSDYNLYEGHFKSPLVDYLSVPKACRQAKFQMIEPTKEKLKKTNLDDRIKPVVIHLAGTGDHWYWKRRTFMAKPLLEYGITSIIVENPYYGGRKPQNQSGSCLLNVEDLFIMGGCLVLECLILLYWLERNNYGPLGITGISLGGHMCSLAGCSWPKPISIIPCLSWTTASCVFTQGVLSGAIPWELLKEQYKHFGEETIVEQNKMIHSPERSDLFHAGRQFAKQYEPLNQQTRQDNESYFEKLDQLNQEKQQTEESQTNGSVDENNGNKKIEQDKFRNFLNTVSFNVYDSLNKTLIDSKNKQDDNPKRDALNFMSGILDECTHLKNFDQPVDSQLSIIVTAKHDGYVPKSNLIPLNQLWAGSHLREIDTGHVAAIIFYHKLFQQAIVDSLDLNARKYYNSKILSDDKSFLERKAENFISESVR